MMENREFLNELFDIYGVFLTDTEQETFKNYYGEDLSLSEIAINRHVSKSSVGKTLKQACEKLINYEENLHVNKTKTNLINLLDIYDLDKLKKELEKIIKG